MGRTPSLRLTIAQVNPTVGDIDGNVDRIISVWTKYDADTDLIVFPELTVTGYIPEDLLLNNGFIAHIETAIATLVQTSVTMKSAILVGAPARDRTDLFNAAYLIEAGKILSIPPIKWNYPTMACLMKSVISHRGHALNLVISAAIH